MVNAENPTGRSLIDQHGRTIRYLRISVTDRCDLRCRYCMAEQMTFLPRAKLLSLDEIAIIAERFIARGVTRIRLSGGEPLVRRDVADLVRRPILQRRQFARLDLLRNLRQGEAGDFRRRFVRHGTSVARSPASRQPICQRAVGGGMSAGRQGPSIPFGGRTAGLS